MRKRSLDPWAAAVRVALLVEGQLQRGGFLEDSFTVVPFAFVSSKDDELLVLEDITIEVVSPATSSSARRAEPRSPQPGEGALLLLKFGLLVLNDKAKQLTLEARAGDREITSEIIDAADENHRVRLRVTRYILNDSL